MESKKEDLSSVIRLEENQYQVDSHIVETMTAYELLHRIESLRMNIKQLEEQIVALRGRKAVWEASLEKSVAFEQMVLEEAKKHQKGLFDEDTPSEKKEQEERPDGN